MGMKKTFEEVIELYMIENNIENYFDITYNDWVILMKKVRIQTLIEVADKADADYNWINDVTDIEVYVLKESILGLDKNSIEL